MAAVTPVINSCISFNSSAGFIQSTAVVVSKRRLAIQGAGYAITLQQDTRARRPTILRAACHTYYTRRRARRDLTYPNAGRRFGHCFIVWGTFDPRTWQASRRHNAFDWDGDSIATHRWCGTAHERSSITRESMQRTSKVATKKYTQVRSTTPKGSLCCICSVERTKQLSEPAGSRVEY